MSEPVKNAEIEDVLSSIRRLVTDGGREAEVSAVPAQAPEPVRDADKLVLTDALRIEETQSAGASATSLPKHVPDTEMAREMQEDMQELRSAVPSFLKRKIEIEAPSDLSGEAPELDELDTEIAAVASPVEPEDTDTLDTGIVMDEASAPVEAPFDDHRPWMQKDALMSEWHSVRTPTADEFEPDAPEDGANAGMPVASLAWEDHVEDTQQVSFEGADRLEEPEEMVSEPVEPVQFIHASEESKEEAPEAIVEEAIADSVIEGVAEVQESAEQPYEAVLDEEMLRDLVGEIVRQELQGPLGERITRNVRKLVRREINRAMTSRSFSVD